MRNKLTRRDFNRIAATTIAAASMPRLLHADPQAPVKLDKNAEPIATGRFKPEWTSLLQYKCPEWFRDAKFGIWQHWGPQCVPERSDWYARNMYQQLHKDGKTGLMVPNDVYNFHCEHYGHPSKFGFKDVINTWNADEWDPDRLAGLYKAAGAKYIVQLANHHDNFDTWNSKYQPWNSVAIGPKKDIVGGWAKATRKQGMYFGVSVHAARAWGWNEFAQTSDTEGPLKGVSYDGNTPPSAGVGKWWNGLDPHDLYAQNHDRKARPDQIYVNKFYNRIMELINLHSPDVLNFDDDYTRAGLPLYNDSPEVGLRLMAHLYNTNERLHDGRLEAVLTGKRLSEDHVPAMVKGIEQGSSTIVEPLPWQTETCIGHWHYDRPLYDNHGYVKSAKVLGMLVDIVSKNGNLLLSIPVRGNGSIDSDEEAILTEIGAWMHINGEAIYGSRPWLTYGEGPSLVGYKQEMMRSMVYTPEDWRFTTKGNTLYAFAMAWPTQGVLTIKALSSAGIGAARSIGTVRMLGTDTSVKFTRTADGIQLMVPTTPPHPGPVAFRITT